MVVVEGGGGGGAEKFFFTLMLRKLCSSVGGGATELVRVAVGGEGALTVEVEAAVAGPLLSFSQI